MSAIGGTRPVLSERMRTVYGVHFRPDNRSIPVDYKLVERLRTMLAKFGINGSSKDEFPVLQAMLGTGLVTRQEGHIILPSAFAMSGAAAIDLVGETIVALGLQTRMPKSEERIVQLVRAVFEALPNSHSTWLPDNTCQTIERLVRSAAV